jgi:hypothetical protein
LVLDGLPAELTVGGSNGSIVALGYDASTAQPIQVSGNVGQDFLNLYKTDGNPFTAGATTKGIRASLITFQVA